jgi:hypothetical protein
MSDNRLNSDYKYIVPAVYYLNTKYDKIECFTFDSFQNRDAWFDRDHVKARQGNMFKGKYDGYNNDASFELQNLTAEDKCKIGKITIALTKGKRLVFDKITTDYTDTANIKVAG